MLNTLEWKEFSLAKLFEFENCKCANASELEEGNDVEYVGAKKSENGHMKFVKNDDDLITKGNCILFICDGQGSVGYSLYMPKDFIGSTTTCAGYNEHLNENIGLFLVTVLDLERPKYSFGRKYKTHLKDTYIKLPADDVGNPNWKYMNEYIEKLKKSKGKNGKNLNDSLNTKNNNPLTFDVNGWKEFKLVELFDEPYKGKAYVKGELEETFNAGIPFVSRTDEDNGCDGYVNGNIDEYEYEKGNAIIIGDTTSTCYYQEEDFICGDHIVILRAAWLNKFTGLFIKTLIEKERYKYSYGRSFKMDLIKNTIIKLPIDNLGNPNWIYVEKFIQSLPFSDNI